MKTNPNDPVQSPVCQPLRRRAAAFATLLALACATPTASAFDGFGEGYIKKLPITVSGYAGATTLTDYPVLVRLNTSITGFSYDDMQSGSADLRFTDAADTELSYEIDTWNTSGDSLIWVKVPVLTGTTTAIKMFYGKAGDTAPTYTTNGSTWSNSYHGVWHMKTANAADSTSNARNATGYGALTTSAGQIGDSQAIAAPGIDRASTPAFTVGQVITISGWFRGEAGSTVYPRIVNNNYGNSYYLGGNDANPRKWLFIVNGNFYTAPTTISESGAWQYVTATFQSGTSKLYINGAYIGGNTGIANPANQTLAWGFGANSGGGEGFKGRMDEIRIASAARSADWVAAEYANQNNPASFLSFATIESASGTFYTITSSAGTGGTISPSGAVSVYEHTNKTFTIAPDRTHSIADVLVNSTTSVLGLLVNNQYTFTDVTANHTIDATFNELPNYTLSGTVKDSWNVGLSGATVTVYLDALCTEAIATATTASGGTFTTPGVIDGTYYLKATLSGYNPMVAPVSRTVAGANLAGVDMTLGSSKLWSGADGGAWNVAGNWVGGTVPGFADTLAYAVGTSGSSVNDLIDASFPSIEFNNGAAAFTLSGSKVSLTGNINGAAIVNNSSNLQTLNLPIGINSTLEVNANAAVTLGGEISGTGTLVKSGTNALTLGGINLYSGGTTLSTGTLNLNSTTALGATAGAFTINGGTIDNTSGGAITLANNNPINWNADFIFTGTQDLNLGAGAVSFTANRQVTVTNSTKKLTVGGTITGTGKTLTKAGNGTLVVSSAGNALGTLYISGGLAGGTGLPSTLLLDNSVVLSPSMTLTAAPFLDVRTALLEINNATFTTPGLTLREGRIVVEGTGSLVTTGGDFTTGTGDNRASAVFVKDSATINGTGRNLTMGPGYTTQCTYVGLRNTAAATFNSVVVLGDANYETAHGSVLELSDSAQLSASGDMFVLRNANDQNRVGTTTGYAQVYQHGGTVTVGGNLRISDNDLAVGTGGATHKVLGAYNLGSGGNLKVAGRIVGGQTRTGYGQSFFNFHGGTLTYTGAGTQTDFINLTQTAGTAGTTSASNLRIWEGATIDTGSKTLTVAQALLAPTGDGINAIAITGLTTQIYSNGIPPWVYIDGGGGTGATAVATLDAAGKVNAIIVTNPGNGYTSIPTVKLIRANETVQTAATGNITLSPNSAYNGGLTKLGSGTLTLTGANTYTGPTTVEAGILAVNGSSIPDTGELVISGGKVQATGIESVNTLFFGTTPKAVGTWGATDSGADHIDDDHFAGTAGVVNVLNLGAGDDYNTWAEPFPDFIDTASGSDPDQDGMTNQQEYAFGLNPTSGASVNPIVAQLDMTSGLFSYSRRNPSLTGLGYTVLTSTDLLDWTPDVGGSQTPDSPIAETQTVTVHVGNPAVGGKLFVRVQAQ